MMTSGQLRAARALLAIDQRTLAAMAAVSLPTIQRMEASDGVVRGTVETLTKVIEALNRVKDSFNSYPLDRLAQAAAQAAYEDDAYFRATCARVMASRTRLTQSLQSLGFEVVPSMANFVFARHPAHDAATLAARLKEQAIFVRHFKLARIDQHLRITVGTEQDNKRLLDALDGIRA